MRRAEDNPPFGASMPTSERPALANSALDRTLERLVQERLATLRKCYPGHERRLLRILRAAIEELDIVCGDTVLTSCRKEPPRGPR